VHLVEAGDVIRVVDGAVALSERNRQTTLPLG
jgi:hypothetical protein